jgi:hypothetical protein
MMQAAFDPINTKLAVFDVFSYFRGVQGDFSSTHTSSRARKERTEEMKFISVELIII